MKKKLLTILSVLVLAVVMIVTTACENGRLFSKNEKRDMTQIASTVTYAGRTSEITKGDVVLSELFTNVQQYYAYYQAQYINETTYKSAYDTFEEYLKQLSQSEAYTLMCIDVLAKEIAENGTSAQKDAVAAASTVSKSFNVQERIAELETLLSDEYLAKARKAYNEDMQSAFDKYKDEYDEEIAAGARTTKSVENIDKLILDTDNVKKEYEKGASEIKLNGLKVSVKYKDVDEAVELSRSDYTVTGFNSDEVTDENTITVTFGSVTETFTVKIVEAKPSRPVMPTDEAEEDDDDPEETEERFDKTIDEKIEEAREDLALFKGMKEAKSRLEKTFESTYRSYDYYYLAQLKTQAVNQVEASLTESITEATAEEIATKYNKLVESQLETLKSDSSKYTEALGGENYATQVVHTDEGCYYVQQVLIKTTDALKALYDAYKKEQPGLSQDLLQAYLNKQVDKTGVYFSNVEYDSEATCEEEDCDCKECENYKGEGPFVCDGTCTCKQCLSKRFVTEEYIKNVGEYISGFAWDEGDVDEDADTINIRSVLKAMKADLGKVEAEATIEEQQAILEKFKKWIYMCNDDSGMFTKVSDGQPGYMLTKSGDGYAKNFAQLSNALAYGEGSDYWDEYEDHIFGSGVGSWGWCYVDTEYVDSNSVAGVFVIMLTGYAVDEDTSEPIEDGKYYVSLPTAIPNIALYEEAEEEGTAAVGTVAANIGKALVEEKQTEAKNTFKLDFYQNKMKDDTLTTIVHRESVYSGLLKSYRP